MRPERILWPTDFSPLSLAAADAARSLAQTFNAALHVIHVAPLLVWESSTAVATGGDLLVGQVDVSGLARAELDRLTTNYLAGIPVTAEVVVGAAWVEICRYASQARIELIVVATHGLTGLRHVLIGSVAERIVQHAPCSVLVVRSPELAGAS